MIKYRLEEDDKKTKERSVNSKRICRESVR